MNGYEKLVKIIRSQIETMRDLYPVKIAVMTSPTSCKFNQMELDKDDLLFAEHLLKNCVTKVDFKISSVKEMAHTHNWNDKSVYGEYVEKLDIEIDDANENTHEHGWKDRSEFISPLKEGDMVLIMKISEEKYAVIEKLVEV